MATDDLGAIMGQLDETGKKMDAVTGKGPDGGGMKDAMGGEAKPAGGGKSSGDPELDSAIDGLGTDAAIVACLKRIGMKLDEPSRAIMKAELMKKGGKFDATGFIGKNGGYKNSDFGMEDTEDEMSS